MRAEPHYRDLYQCTTVYIEKQYIIAMLTASGVNGLRGDDGNGTPVGYRLTPKELSATAISTLLIHLAF